ncbi:MAG: TonB-dependent siderophore receptor [Cyanobacteria bacterium P01_B01_bin.77]
MSVGLGTAVLIAAQPALAIDLAPLKAVETNAKTTEPAAIESTAVAQADVVVITSIQLEETVQGFTLQLETSNELPIPQTSITGNGLTADIPNAILRLAETEEFQISDPVAGIALVTVINLPNNQVQIAIIGTDAPPVVNLITGATGLTVSAQPGDAVTQTAADDSLRIVVTGEQAGYLVSDTSTATRTNTPLRDIPQSIQVIPRQIIDDQQAIGLEEVLDNAAGVTFLGNNDGRGLDISIRGFDNAPVLRDGVLLPFFGGDAAEPELANLERVDVLRGPVSVYGQAEPGGVINLVTKKPLAEPYYNLQFQGGNRGFISPSVDISGPVTEDGRLLYRLNALYRREDSFRDVDSDFERFFIAPTLTWLISDRTDLTLNLEYTKDNEPLDFGTLAFGDGIADISPERVLTGSEATVEQDYLNVGYTLEHRFSDNWSLQNQFRYTSSSYDYSIFAAPLFLDESTGILDRFVVDQFGETDTYSLYTNAQGKFKTGSVQHRLLFGIDLNRVEDETITRSNFEQEDFFSPINIFEPDDLAFPRFSDDSLVDIFDDSPATRRDQLGIYLQDQIDILDNLILVAGLRYDLVDQETTLVVTGEEASEQQEEALTPRIGIVYQPIEPISLYANYSRSFVPNSATDTDGQLLEPEEGEGFEVGIRGEIIENRLAVNLAYFDITKQNVATDDPNDPFFASIATGEQRSRGVDVNLTGEILPGWNMVASYAYIDAEITEDNTFPVGNRLSGVPEQSASLWTTYEIQSGDLQGLGFGLGVNFVDERQGDLSNSFQADSYFLTNAAVFYRRNNWQARLNIDNLFDIDFIESVSNSDRTRRIYPGDPLTVRASVSYTF